MHHRFLWMHPFLDGNGRIARLMSHALFQRLGIGTSLWSVARGLARNDARHNALRSQADGPREADRDGRGNLTQRDLIAFTRFFLDQSVNEIRFMSGLLEPAMLMTRIEVHVVEETRAKRLMRGSFAVQREAVIAGKVEQPRIPSLTGHEARGARNVTPGDCRKFRVREDMMGRKETPHGPTQGTAHP